jgi:predicted nucleotidyltransferase
MSQIARASIEALREHGYAVVTVAPDDMNGIDPEIIEQRMQETFLNVVNEQGLNNYLVTHFESDPDEDQQFECQATDINAVIELFENRFSGNTIQGIELQ